VAARHIGCGVFLALLGLGATRALVGLPEGYAAPPDLQPEIALESIQVDRSTDLFRSSAPGRADPAVVSPNEDAQPSISPQGHLAFTSDRSGNFDIYVKQRGGETVQVTSHPAPDYEPAWSVEGARIAFVSERTGNPDIFAALTKEKASPARLTLSPAVDINPAWSPEGFSLAFASNRKGNYDIWILELGRSPKQLTNNNDTDFDPAWSPDGRKIAFTRRNSSGNYDIYVKNADGSGLKRLTNSPAEDAEPNWSPTGDQIAFVTDRDGDYEIYVMDADGTRKRNFSQDAKTANLSPDWQVAPSAADSRVEQRRTITLGGVTCGPLSGTAASETLTGTPSADVICGRGGADTIIGGGGNDILDGGPGKDILRGGPGKDRIVARDGLRDQVQGGVGNDRARTDGSPRDDRKSIEAPL
jgi:WD40-like Beta Propeller Repeat/RTX calcium-binding nonapeptide repeat (4 copies)